jgi:hypothetical protein
MRAEAAVHDDAGGGARFKVGGVHVQEALPLVVLKRHTHELVHEIAGLWVARRAARFHVAQRVAADAPRDEV